jgi:hypothetical protein
VLYRPSATTRQDKMNDRTFYSAIVGCFLTTTRNDGAPIEQF